MNEIDMLWIFEAFFRSTKTTIYITTAVVEADFIDYTRQIWLTDNAMQDKVTRCCLYGLSYIEKASKRKKKMF
jgi:hypothetical protein